MIPVNATVDHLVTHTSTGSGRDTEGRLECESLGRYDLQLIRTSVGHDLKLTWRETMIH